MQVAFSICLLIDDNPLDNYINTLLIKHYNFAKQVITLECPQEALKFIGNGSIQPDIIFLDINMPFMDGFEFIKEYSKLDNINQATKIFMLSSSCDPSDIYKAESNKYVTKFIEKTLTGEKLADIINTHETEPRYHYITDLNLPNQLSV